MYTQLKVFKGTLYIIYISLEIKIFNIKTYKRTRYQCLFISFDDEMFHIQTFIYRIKFQGGTSIFLADFICVCCGVLFVVSFG